MVAHERPFNDSRKTTTNKKTERSDLEDAFIGTCQNCHKENVKVRRVEAKGLFNETRGFYDVCFACFAPQVYTKVRGRIVQSPMETEER